MYKELIMKSEITTVRQKLTEGNSDFQKSELTLQSISSCLLKSPEMDPIPLPGLTAVSNGLLSLSCFSNDFFSSSCSCFLASSLSDG